MCADVVTPVYQFTLPDIGASDSTWGDKLNDDWAKVEALFVDAFTGGTPTDLGKLKAANMGPADTTDTNNFNTISANGVYSNNVGNAVGAPNTNPGFIVLHNEMPNDNAVQTASRPAGAANLEFGYIRTRYNGVWTAWDQAATLTTYPVTNFNTITVTGDYTNTVAATGAPTTAVGYLLSHVQSPTAGFAMQTCSRPAGAAAADYGWVRLQANGVWTAWDYYATADTPNVFTEQQTFRLPIVGEAVTQSAVDETASRLLKVGDYGLSNTPIDVTDFNSPRVTGLYTNSVAAANTPNGGTGANWLVWHMQRSTGANGPAFQIAMRPGANDALIYARSRNTGPGWQPWFLLGNAVTLVSNNFDTITVTGDYTNTTAGIPGAPASGADWLLHHTQSPTTGFAMQTCSRPAGFEVADYGYVRFQRNGVWTAWDYYATADTPNVFTQQQTFRLPIVGEAVTQSKTDVTAGRLLKVGDYGMGLVPVVTTNFNTLTVSGTYTNTATATGAPTATLNWLVGHVQLAVGDAMQVASRPSGYDIAEYGYVRFQRNGTWTAWDYYTTADTPNVFTKKQTFNNYIDGTAITQTQTDNSTGASIGRLLKVGDYGLSNQPIVLTDFNSPICTGIYTNDAAALWSPDGSTSVGWILLHLQRANGVNGPSFQMAMRPNSPDNYIYTRTRTPAGVWSTWSFNYGNDTIVGPVSMLGGVPNGAIIETGSSANGSYTKFADGTLICTHPAIDFVNCQAANGALFQSAATTTWTFPSPFLAGTFPSISGSCDDTDMWPTTGTYNHLSAVIRAKSSVTKATPKGFAMMAIGRWF